MRFHRIILGVLGLVISGCSSSPNLVTPPPPEVRLEAPLNLSFESNGVVLQGTLEAPQQSGPYPVLVFVHGSGRVTRSSYQAFADYFLPRGYAVFRYDKRGVGASGGVYSEVGPANSNTILRQLGEDAHAAVQTLKRSLYVDSTRIILLGASQAGWIIPVAATLSQNVALAVLIVSPTVTVGEEIFYSNLTENTNLSDEEISRRLASFSGVRGFDPAPFIAQMRMPSVWILGGKDRSIPTRESIQILENLIATSSKPFTIKLYPEGNHSLINQSTGQIENFIEYTAAWLAEKFLVTHSRR